ncbi:carboxypeptidase-like regulatory domain-containing protein [Vulcanisaeta thermophila]|uniref:carboxypeptidase-like regulatory domain-containing protein n=1 Tax=Vulcanisaeta thermophila TaxID=867917 RepID=UPI0008531425|nr:carboxypeptidase-like regulatory domain-containing protein [Vulcanisaeta thermophila]
MRRIPKIATLIILAVSISVLVFASQAQISQNVNAPVTVIQPYYGILEYIDYINMTRSATLAPGQSITIQAPLPPGPGYSLSYMEVSLNPPSPAISISGANVMYSKNEIGAVISAYTTSNQLTITNSGNQAINETLSITFVFTKEEYIPLNTTSSSFTVNVTIPDNSIQYVTKQVVRFEIANYMPFEISNIALPNGTTLSQLVSQWSPLANYIKIEPKYVELTANELPPGMYSIGINYGSEYVMPSAMLIKGTEFLNYTVNPGQTLEITGSEFGVPPGWNLLGYIVAVYTVQPLVVGQQPGHFELIANRVSSVSLYSALIQVSGISYLLPPFIRFAPTFGIYIVYDRYFEVVDNLNVPLVVTFMPIIYKPVGQWINGNLKVTVSNADVSGGLWTALVVQLPEIAHITRIVTPSGTVYTGLVNSEVPWGSTVRLVSISPDGSQAYIAVSTLGVSETGTYTIYVNWTPIEMQFTNTLGSPISGVDVDAYVNGSLISTATSGANGIAYIGIKEPEPFTAVVSYDNVPIYYINVNSLINQPIGVTIGLYNVTVLFVGARGQAISNAQVSLYRVGTGPTYNGTTNNAGFVQLNNVLSGTYLVTVQYKGLKYSEFVTINGNEVITVKSDILAIIAGVPITTLEALIGTLGLGGAAAIAFTFVNGRRGKDYDVVTM